MRTLVYTARALRALTRLDKQVAQQIRAKLGDYAEFDRGDVTAMKGEANTFRMRVRDWRVVFTANHDTIVVRAVGHRRDVYK